MGDRVVVGRYRLLEQIGTGGMSEVWAAEDVELERRVAIKMLGRDADRARFEREARAAAGLSHPNVVQLFDYGEAEEGRPFMVLELLPGGTLEDVLAAGEALPDDEAGRIAYEVASGLAHAHARGLVHRDLKPANVLFDAEGRAKIADFGIARVGGAGTLTEAGTVMGTAAYISPEQATGETASSASDVYSFGVILYRMITGRLPFEAAEPLAIVRMHVEEAPTPVAALRADAPSALESVAMAALAKDPADRPPDGNALVDELSRFQATLPLGSAATSSMQAIGPRRSAPRGLRLALVLLAVAALAAGGIALAAIATGSDDASDEVPFTTSRGDTLPTTREDTEPLPSEPATTRAATTQATTKRTTTAPTPPAETIITETDPITDTGITEPPATTTEPPATTTEPPPTTTG